MLRCQTPSLQPTETADSASASGSSYRNNAYIDLFLPDVSGDSFTIQFGRDGELNVSLYINWFNIM